MSKSKLPRHVLLFSDAIKENVGDLHFHIEKGNFGRSIKAIDTIRNKLLVLKDALSNCACEAETMTLEPPPH